MAFLKHVENAWGKRILLPVCGVEDWASALAMNPTSRRFPSDSALSGSIKTTVTRQSALATRLAKVVKAILVADGVMTERKLDLALVWTARYLVPVNPRLYVRLTTGSGFTVLLATARATRSATETTRTFA